MDQGSGIAEIMLRRYNYNPEGLPEGAECNEKDTLNSDWLRQNSNETSKKTLRCLGTFCLGFFWLFFLCACVCVWGGFVFVLFVCLFNITF